MHVQLMTFTIITNTINDPYQVHLFYLVLEPYKLTKKHTIFMHGIILYYEFSHLAWALTSWGRGTELGC